MCETGVLETCTGSGGSYPFITSWSRSVPTQGLAGGGQKVTVVGLGFGEWEKGYQCVWRSRHHEEVAAAVAKGPTRVICYLPEWRSTAEMVNLTLRKDGHGVPTAAGDGSYERPFRVLEAWDAISTPAYPLSSAGGFPITVHGAGFATGGGWKCTFASSSGAVMHTDAVAVSLTEARCSAPKWGVFLPSGMVGFGLNSSTTGLAVAHGSDVVRICTVGDARCGVRLSAYATSVLPRNASTSGGETISISGGGFANGRPLYCRFGGPEPLTPVEEVLATVASPTSASCIAPHWAHGGGQFQFSLSEVAGGGGSFDPIMVETGGFLWRSAWTSRNGSEGGAGGGGLITLQGAGFTDLDLRCVFEGGDGRSAEAVGDALGDSLFVCQAPKWPFKAESTIISVFAVASTSAGGTRSELRWEGGADGNRSYIYTEEWESISPSRGPSVTVAGSNALLTVYGHGFGTASEYNCSFTRGMEAMSSAAVGGTPNEVVCELPQWGEEFKGSWDGTGSGQGADELAPAPVNVTLLHDSLPVEGTPASFGFYSAWISVAVQGTGTPFEGGREVVVTGGGFAQGVNYTCRWSDAAAGGSFQVTSSPVERTNVTAVTCASPAWSGSAQSMRARLSILATPLGGGGSAPVVVSYLGNSRGDIVSVTGRLAAVSPTQAPAKGGVVLNVTGAGFVNGISCIFTPPLGASISPGGGTPPAFASSLATLVSPFEINCPAPTWMYASSDWPASLSLSHAAVTFEGEHLKFNFSTGWDAHSAPQNAPATGQAITLSSYGIVDPEAHNLTCILGGAVVMDAVLADPDTGDVECSSACWGCTLGAGSHVLSLIVDGRSVNYTGVPGGDMVTLGEIVTGATPTSGAGSGPQLITVAGAGFLPGKDAGYTCVFTGGGHSQTSPANASSFTQVECFAPMWSYGSQLTAVTLNGSSGSIPGQGKYAFEDRWSAASPSAGPLRGGTIVTVTGGGFLGVTYSCYFGEEEAAVPATVWNATQLTCASPPAPNGPSATPLAFGVIDSAGRKLPGGAGMWGYYAGWDGFSAASPSSVPAYGGETITLSGYGLGSGRGYRVVFFNAGGDEMHADYTYVVPGTGVKYGSPDADWTRETLVAAVVPAWGSLLDGGMTGIRLETTEGESVPYTSGGTAASECTPPACGVILAPAIIGLATTQTFVRASAGSAVSMITSGVSASYNYSCVYSYDGPLGSYSTRSPGTRISSSAFSCSPPEVWDFPEVEDALLVVRYESNGTMQVRVIALSKYRFTP